MALYLEILNKLYIIRKRIKMIPLEKTLLAMKW